MNDKPRIGACDICNAQNVEIAHGCVSGIETFYCAEGCIKDDPRDEIKGPHPR